MYVLERCFSTVHICIRENSHRLDSHLPACFDDSPRNLAPVSDQNFIEGLWIVWLYAGLVLQFSKKPRDT